MGIFARYAEASPQMAPIPNEPGVYNSRADPQLGLAVPLLVLTLPSNPAYIEIVCKGT